MKFDLTTNINKKIGLFTDIHFGINKDNQLRLNETKRCVNWMIKTFKEQSVDYVIFCGDLFDSRFSINVQTLNYAIDCIQKIAFNFQKIFLLIGNHDTYYKNNNDMNSINFLSKIAMNDNIIIVETDPYFIQIQNKTLGLFPWGFDIESIKNIDNFQICDYGFGHFEVNGVEQSGSVSSGCKYHYKDLMQLSPHIFSGHYHNTMHYIHNNNIVYMLGSPLQLNWGEWDKEKFIYTFDCINDVFEPFQNTINSRFEKIYYSQMEKYTKEQLTKLCDHNFIKFVIDTKYQFENVLKYTDIIKEYKPLSFQIEYLISLTSDVILESTEDIVKSNSKDNKEYLLEYIQKIFKQVQQVDDSIKLDILNQLVEQYYNKSLMVQSERKDN